MFFWVVAMIPTPKSGGGRILTTANSRLQSLHDTLIRDYPVIEESYTTYKSLISSQTYSEYKNTQSQLILALNAIACADTSDKFCVLAVNIWMNAVNLYLAEMGEIQRNYYWWYAQYQEKKKNKKLQPKYAVPFLCLAMSTSIVEVEDFDEFPVEKYKQVSTLPFGDWVENNWNEEDKDDHEFITLIRKSINKQQ
jgi:hypothetical protein